MTEDRKSPIESARSYSRKPRVALMGEFSAGKSTLANLLLGHNVSPVQVTATQLPPVWYTHGAPSALRVDNFGEEIPISATALENVSHEHTQAVRILLKTDVLEFCDLIDTPGTSDPNLQHDLWQRVLEHVDCVVWCTPATQAWRQSEAAFWEQLPERLRACSLLLVTRVDKLQSEAEKDRVLARVRRETNGLFKQVLPISLIAALSDPEDPEVLASSGAERFVESLIEIMEMPETLSGNNAPMTYSAIVTAGPTDQLARPAPVATTSDSVVPRRVSLKRARLRTRPTRVSETDAVLTRR